MQFSLQDLKPESWGLRAKSCELRAGFLLFRSSRLARIAEWTEVASQLLTIMCMGLWIAVENEVKSSQRKRLHFRAGGID